MTAWQRRLPLALIACSLVGLVAISATRATPSVSPPLADQSSTAPSPGATFDLTPRMAIVYDAGGRGTSSFNELAWEGAKRAADALGAELREVTANPDDTDADREQRLAELADALYYPIFAVGSSYAGPLAKVAPMYPDTWFGIVDDGTVHAPNVIGIQFNDEQGAFLVGAAAALTSKTGNVGFIGAVENPPHQKLEAGFAAGARTADPDVTVQVAYLSQSSDDAGPPDPGRAREATLDMYDAGADVIYGAVGDSNSAVIEAAHDRGLWAIGTTSDQYLLANPSVRGAILTSMLKHADVATYTIAREVAYGSPKDGNNVFGLDRGGVGYATSGGFVDPIKAQLDAFAAEIASGTILVPRTP